MKKFEAKFGASIYLTAILALLLLQLVFSSFYLSISPVEGSLTQSIVLYLAAICFQLGYLAVFLIFLKSNDTRPIISLNFKINPLFYVAGVLGAILCLVFFFPAAYAFDVFLDYLGLAASDAFKDERIIEKILLIVSTVILAPVCEELIYRGGLLSGLSLKLENKYKGKFGDILGAVLCAALGGLAFSLMHMSPRQTVYQFFLGYAAVMLALSARSIVPAIALHMFSNLIAVLSGFIEPLNAPFVWIEGSVLTDKASLITWSIILSIAGICAFTGLYRLLKRYSKPKEQIEEILEAQNMLETNIKQKNRFYLIIFIGLIICVFMWAAQFISLLALGKEPVSLLF